MSSYRIWFKVQGFEEIELPVNPQEVSITYPGNPTNYDVEGLGEIIVPRLPKLATTTFESFFPREMLYQTVINSDSWYSPEWYVNFFRNVQKKRQPFELTIVRGFDDIREYDSSGNYTINRNNYFDTVFPMAVLLDFAITDKGGEPGDIYYNMSISEYRDATPKTLAELAEESVDDNGEVTQKMVLAINRPQQSGAIVVNRVVEISGNVYDQPDSPGPTSPEPPSPEPPEPDASTIWSKTKQRASQVDRVVSRVLPPSVSGKLHSVYVSGLGWVDKGNCKLAENYGAANGINRLITDNYD